MQRTDISLVTLIGPPGIGKTRLSIEVARAILNDFHDGVFFVALAPVDDSSLIAITIAQALGYVGARNISINEQLKEGIGEKQMLIVLDNCEHLIEDIASLASSLLSACPHLKILATSRESLRIPGEWLYPVPAFDVPDEDLSIDLEALSSFPALTLFAERARAVRADFVLNAENAKTVSAICAHLDGLPLAIELIAARMRLMSPQTLLKRLNDQFILSADGMRAASARQNTLNDAIGWSYNLLSSDEQKLFAYLSVFSGGFMLDAVEMIFSKIAQKPVSDLIALLLDKSLLQRTLDKSGEPLFTMLATIQKFAREQLREMGEETDMCNWHLAYFLDLAEKADKELRGYHQFEWLSRLDSDRDNLRAALDWAIETGQTELALQMARKLDWFWHVRGYHIEGLQWLERALRMPDAYLYPEAQAEVLAHMAHHIYLQAGPKYARPSAEQAISIARTHTDKHNTARELAILGLVLGRHEKDFLAAQAALEESQALYQQVHDEWGYAHAVMCLAWVSYQRDDYVTMYSVGEEALARFRKLGDRFFECVVLRGIGVSQMMQGDLIRAKTAFRAALILAQQLESKHEAAQTLWRFAEAAQREGRITHAVSLYWAAKRIFESIGAWQQENEAEFENELAPCRVTLDEAEFAAAVEAGRAMTMEQAIAYALEDSDS